MHLKQDQSENIFVDKNSIRNIDSSEETKQRVHNSRENNIFKRDSSIQEHRLEKFITKISNKISKQLIG